MNNRYLGAIISWTVVVFLLLLITPVSTYNRDFLGAFIVVAIIFALGALYFAFRDDGAQNLTEIEQEVSQLRYEIKTLHMKLDEIKRLVEI